MKKLFFLMLIISVTYFTSAYSQQAQYGFWGNYYTGVLGNGIEHDYLKFRNPSINFDLNLSLWHHYCNWTESYPHGWDNGWTDWEPNDWLLGTLNQYQSAIQSRLSTNAGYNYRTIMDRIKLNRLCYGQRSEYQAEKKSFCDDDYNFYSFETSVDNGQWAHDIIDNDPYHGEGQYVKHCWPMPELEAGNPVIILKDLNANREQVNITGWTHPYEIDQYHTFHFKPRMRININESLSHNLDLSI